MPRSRGLIIAIDGVVSAGKSTTARKVAARLGYIHLDTGAMYRALTLAASRRGIAPDAGEALAQLLADLRLDLEPGGQVRLDGEDVSDTIRRPEISRQVGAYADVPQVRRALVQRQQDLGADGGVVAEGRDVGSVVFPAADLKIHLVAALDERARRRYQELLAKGVSTSLGSVKEDIRARDREDKGRDYGAGPDQAATLELDTTGLTVEEQVERIVAWARERGACLPRTETQSAGPCAPGNTSTSNL